MQLNVTTLFFLTALYEYDLINPNFHLFHNKIETNPQIFKCSKGAEDMSLFPELEAPWTTASSESRPKYKIRVALIEKLIKFLKASAVIPARQPLVRLSGDELHIVADGWGPSLCYTGTLGHWKYRL